MTPSEIEAAAREIVVAILGRTQDHEYYTNKARPILTRHFAPAAPEGEEGRLQKLIAFAVATEKWECDMIMDNKAWRDGHAPLPTLTYPLWDRLLELQAMRNEALEGIERPITPASGAGA